MDSKYPEVRAKVIEVISNNQPIKSSEVINKVVSSLRIIPTEVPEYIYLE